MLRSKDQRALATAILNNDDSTFNKIVAAQEHAIENASP